MTLFRRTLPLPFVLLPGLAYAQDATLPQDLVLLGHGLECGLGRQSGVRRADLGFGDYLDDRAGQGARAHLGRPYQHRRGAGAPRCRRARYGRRHAAGSSPRTLRGPAPGRPRRDRRLRGRRPRRHQRAYRLAARAHRGPGRPHPDPRYRPTRHHRRHRTLRRPVRHGVGHHERLHRHLPQPDHQPRRRRPGNCRGPARHRVRPRRRHSRRRDLQHVQPRDRRPEGPPGRRRRRNHAPPLARSRPGRTAPISAPRGSPWRSSSGATTTSYRRRTRST